MASKQKQIAKIETQGKRLVFNIYKYYLTNSIVKYENDESVIDLVSDIVKLPKTTVSRIIAEGKRTNYDNIKDNFKFYLKKNRKIERKLLDVHTMAAVRRTLLGYYQEQKRLPTLSNLNKYLKNENILDSGPDLRSLLKNLGFRQSKSGMFLYEHYKYILKRYKYLKLIKQYREEGLNIIFMDGAYISETDFLWQEDERGITRKTTKIPGYILLHAASCNGLINKAYYAVTLDYNSRFCRTPSLNIDVISEWVQNKLIPNLPSNSVIVMNTTPYHCAEVNRKPTILSLKKDIIDWLIKHNVPCDESMIKCELVELAKSVKVEVRFTIDEIAKAHGHRVLFIPPGYPELNPMTYVWEQTKTLLIENCNTGSDLEKNVLTAKTTITKLPVTQIRRWFDMVKHSEDTYFNYDITNDDVMDEVYCEIKEQPMETAYDCDSNDERYDHDSSEFSD